MISVSSHVTVVVDVVVGLVVVDVLEDVLDEVTVLVLEVVTCWCSRSSKSTSRSMMYW